MTQPADLTIDDIDFNKHFHPLSSGSHGVIKGRNFMTPNVEMLREGVLFGERCVLEISRENPPYFPGRSTPMYGVTIKRMNGESFHPELSKCCDSHRDSIDYVKELILESMLADADA